MSQNPHSQYAIDFVNTANYYPFGMQMAKRTLTNGDPFFSDESHRYSFQGQEKDDEIKGEGNSINYTYRMHDPRIGRFFSLDPLAPSYPWNSPYAFSENVVIHAVELEGREKELIFFMDPSLNKYRNTRTSIELKEDKKYYNLGKTNAVSFGIDLAPGIGDVKGLVEVFTGKDFITGEELGVWKWLGMLGLSEFKVFKSADEIFENALKNSEKVDNTKFPFINTKDNVDDVFENIKNADDAIITEPLKGNKGEMTIDKKGNKFIKRNQSTKSQGGIKIDKTIEKQNKSGKPEEKLRFGKKS